MTKVALVHDFPGYVGGAEMTMFDFITSAPKGVEVTKLEYAAVAVVGNVPTQGPSLIDSLEGKRVVRYFNDMDPHGDPDLRRWFLENALCVFTSGLHWKRWPWGFPERAQQIPPAIDLKRFKPTRQQRRHSERSGSCAIGTWRGPGKGQQLVKEWSDANGPVDVYGEGAFVPHGPNLVVKGALPSEQVPQTLWAYDTFVHLPTDTEPFGRAVVEAWAAGCKLVVNGNVGAVSYLEHPERLRGANKRFWQAVLK